MENPFKGMPGEDTGRADKIIEGRDPESTFQKVLDGVRSAGFSEEDLTDEGIRRLNDTVFNELGLSALCLKFVEEESKDEVKSLLKEYLDILDQTGEDVVKRKREIKNEVDRLVA